MIGTRRVGFDAEEQEFDCGREIFKTVTVLTVANFLATKSEEGHQARRIDCDRSENRTFAWFGPEIEFN